MAEYVHYKSLMDPKYLGAWAFVPGEQKQLTIAKAAREEVVGENGRKENKLVVRWRERALPMICNATNAKMITELAGTPNILGWPGTVVTLAVERVKAKGGGLTDGIRVQQSAEVATTAEICADCGAAIEASGEFTVRAIVASTAKRFGRVLCMECANKEAAEAAEVGK